MHLFFTVGSSLTETVLLDCADGTAEGDASSTTGSASVPTSVPAAGTSTGSSTLAPSAVVLEPLWDSSRGEVSLGVLVRGVPILEPALDDTELGRLATAASVVGVASERSPPSSRQLRESVSAAFEDVLRDTLDAICRHHEVAS